MSSCVWRCVPMTPLYDPSMNILRLSCRWMENVMLLVSGGRVVSLPCHQLTFAPFETDGFTKGGATHGGMPFFIRYVGVTPLVRLGNVWVSVKPIVCADPVTAINSAKQMESRALDIGRA